VTAWYDVALGVATEGGRQFDPIEVSAWTAYVRSACDRCPETWRQLWYDDVDSFRAKVELALFGSLRGIGIWALGYSGTRHDLWTALALAKGEIGDEVPPTGEATLDPSSRQGQRNGLPVVRDVVRVPGLTRTAVCCPRAPCWPMWWTSLYSITFSCAPLGPSYRLHAPRYFWASAVSLLLLLPAAAYGLARAASGTRPTALLTLAASTILVGLVFFPHERFRLPVLDPALIAGAALCASRNRRLSNEGDALV
jgi:hypothetical protein